MLTQDHLEHVLERLQQIAAVATAPEPPLTASEALECMIEELELGGYGSPEPPPRH